MEVISKRNICKGRHDISLHYNYNDFVNVSNSESATASLKDALFQHNEQSILSRNFIIPLERK